jgi:hypothetical protein
MSKYAKKVKRMKAIQAVLVLACLVLTAGYIYYLNRPVVVSYQLQDECVPIGGQISHSLDDEDICANACNAYCTSVKKTFKKVEFLARSGPECNYCNCLCK